MPSLEGGVTISSLTSHPITLTLIYSQPTHSSVFPCIDFFFPLHASHHACCPQRRHVYFKISHPLYAPSALLISVSSHISSSIHPSLSESLAVVCRLYIIVLYCHLSYFWKHLSHIYYPGVIWRGVTKATLSLADRREHGRRFSSASGQSGAMSIF